MKKKLIQFTLIVIMLAALTAGGFLNIRRAVMILPHVVVLNVASGCTLNGEPFGKTWTVSDPSGTPVWTGTSETQAVQVLLNECN